MIVPNPLRKEEIFQHLGASANIRPEPLRFAAKRAGCSESKQGFKMMGLWTIAALIMLVLVTACGSSPPTPNVDAPTTETTGVTPDSTATPSPTPTSTVCPTPESRVFPSDSGSLSDFLQSLSKERAERLASEINDYREKTLEIAEAWAKQYHPPAAIVPTHVELAWQTPHDTESFTVITLFEVYPFHTLDAETIQDLEDDENPHIVLDDIAPDSVVFFGLNPSSDPITYDDQPTIDLSNLVSVREIGPSTHTTPTTETRVVNYPILADIEQNLLGAFTDTIKQDSPDSPLRLETSAEDGSYYLTLFDSEADTIIADVGQIYMVGNQPYVEIVGADGNISGYPLSELSFEEEEAGRIRFVDESGVVVWEYQEQAPLPEAVMQLEPIAREEYLTNHPEYQLWKNLSGNGPDINIYTKDTGPLPDFRVIDDEGKDHTHQHVLEVLTAIPNAYRDMTGYNGLVLVDIARLVDNERGEEYIHLMPYVDYYDGLRLENVDEINVHYTAIPEPKISGELPVLDFEERRTAINTQTGDVVYAPAVWSLAGGESPLFNTPIIRTEVDPDSDEKRVVVDYHMHSTPIATDETADSTKKTKQFLFEVFFSSYAPLISLEGQPVAGLGEENGGLEAQLSKAANHYAGSNEARVDYSFMTSDDYVTAKTKAAPFYNFEDIHPTWKIEFGDTANSQQ